MSSPIPLAVADVICSVLDDSVIVDESEGGIILDITISREVQIPFVCEIETQPISAEGTYVHLQYIAMYTNACLIQASYLLLAKQYYPRCFR